MKKVVLIFVFLFALTSSYANNFNDLKSSDIENSLIENVVLNEFNFKSLSIDFIGFTSSVEVENDLTSINTSQADKIEVEMFDYWVRYCIYRNGRKYCTEWEYVIELDEVVIIAN
jgi:hypothetical protein